MMVTEPKNLAEYRKSDLLRRETYNYVAEIKYKDHFEWSVLDILNEVFYQCARIMEDPSPEDNIEYHYLRKVGEWDYEKSEDDKTYIVFSLVWGVLSLQENLPEPIPAFLSYLKNIIREHSYFEKAEKFFYKKLYNKYGLFHTDIAPNPSSKSFPDTFYHDDIKEITDDFNTEKVISILQRYRTIEDQEFILGIIKRSLFKIHPEEDPTLDELAF